MAVTHLDSDIIPVGLEQAPIPFQAQLFPTRRERQPWHLVDGPAASFIVEAACVSQIPFQLGDHLEEYISNIAKTVTFGQLYGLSVEDVMDGAEILPVAAARARHYDVVILGSASLIELRTSSQA